MRGLLIAAALLVATAGSAMASTISVSFSGSVGPMAGEIQGVHLTQGDSFSGSFTFDTNGLTPTDNFSSVVYAAKGAIKIDFQVGSDTFSYDGGNNSSVTLKKEPAGSPNQQFTISSSNISPYFSSFTLSTTGAGLYGDAGNLESLSFDNLPGTLSFLDNNGGFTSASLNATSVSVAVAATPIPATLPLLLSALGGLGWIAMRRRKTVFAVATAA
jgi:hypothetical protein